MVELKVTGEPEQILLVDALMEIVAKVLTVPLYRFEIYFNQKVKEYYCMLC